MIRPLTTADIPELERVQNITLAGSLPTAFGPRFFRLYYESLMAQPQFASSGFFWESRMAGFLTYTTDSSVLLGAALRRCFFDYCFTVGGSVLARPRRLRLIAGLLPGVFSPASEPGSDVKAELLSFGVLKEFRSGSDFFKQQRTHVAVELLHSAFATLKARGSPQVKIFIQSEDRNAFINQFYRREGFRFIAPAQRFGFPCNYYVRDL